MAFYYTSFVRFVQRKAGKLFYRGRSKDKGASHIYESPSFFLFKKIVYLTDKNIGVDSMNHCRLLKCFHLR